MTDHGTTTSFQGSPPARSQAVRPVRSELGKSTIALVVAIVAAVWLWAGLRLFYNSLGVGDTARTIWLAVLVVIGAAGLVEIAFGVLAVVRSAQSGKAAAQDVVGARVRSARAKACRSYVGGIGLSLGLVGFLGWFVSNDNAAIRRTFARGDILRDTFPSVLEGFWLNVRCFMVAQVLILVWSLIVALARLYPGRQGAPIRWLATIYSDVFRGFPGIITIYLIVFGLQIADPPLIDRFEGQDKTFVLAVIALTLLYGAYVSEVFRAGLESIHWSQVAASRSLGLSSAQTYRYVVVPQATRRMVPPLLNDFIALQKDTAILSVVGFQEAFNRAQGAATRLFNPSPILGAGLCFLIITIPLARFTDWLIARDQRSRAGG
jgi:polar amino acid transport system permease protein